jgi:hypothetical protein
MSSNYEAGFSRGNIVSKPSNETAVLILQYYVSCHEVSLELQAFYFFLSTKNIKEPVK